MNTDLLAYIDVIAQEKGVDKELVFEAIESAMATAIRKKIGAGDDLVVKIHRKSGEFSIYDSEGEYDFPPAELGRIAAQATKQGIIQKLREAERDVVYEDFDKRVAKIVTGKVQRFEGDNIIINLGKTEALLPREERVRGENLHVGQTVRILVTNVTKIGTRVRIIVSRASADLVKELFRLEVPEIADGIIEVKRIVRDPGYRTKVAVLSHDPKIDCQGACVGVRGSRIRAITDELNGEKVDIVKWSDSLEELVVNALKPAEIDIDNIYPDEETRSVLVLVDESNYRSRSASAARTSASPRASAAGTSISRLARSTRPRRSRSARATSASSAARRGSRGDLVPNRAGAHQAAPPRRNG